MSDEDSVLLFDAVYSIENGTRRTSERECSSREREIICTGCSYTFGHGLNDEDSWPWQLQERLDSGCVINVACMAYGTDQALLAAEKWIKRSSGENSIILLGYSDSQIDRNISPQGWLVHLYPAGKPHYILSGDTLLSKGIVRFYSLPKILHWSLAATRVANKIANVSRGKTNREAGRELTARIIIQAARKFKAAGCMLIVIKQPWNKEHLSGYKADHEYILKRLRNSGIEVILPRFPYRKNGTFDEENFTLYPGRDPHPNHRYNECLADTIAQYLKNSIY